MDVSSLGIRESDGQSILRKPNTLRWSALSHLNLEEQVIGQARRPIRPLVTEQQVRAELDRHHQDLDGEQHQAVISLLTADRAMALLTAPAGAGKTRTIAAAAKVWHALTGGRLIGLTLSENAARVMKAEGLPEAYNIARFLGKCRDSDRLRHPVHVGPADKLVIDEASQVGTADLALIQQAAGPAGVLGVGDPVQLGPVEAGGWFSWFATELGAAELPRSAGSPAPGRRTPHSSSAAATRAPWPRTTRTAGSVPETAKPCTTKPHWGSWPTSSRARTPSWWPGPTPKPPTLHDASRTSSSVQDACSSHSSSSPTATGQASATSCGPGKTPRRSTPEGSRWPTATCSASRAAPTARYRSAARSKAAGPSPFLIPERYLADHGELGYAGNTHVAQGRTTDTAHLLVTGSLNRRSLYVGMTRGRKANTAYVATGEPVPGKEPELVNPEVVLAEIIGNDATELTATEAIRQAQEWSASTGHLANIWAAAMRDTVKETIDSKLKERLAASEYQRYLREPQRQPLQHALTERELNGENLTTLIERITSADLTGARSISAVLHGRLACIEKTREHTQHLGPADPGKRPSARPRGRQGDRRPDHRARHALRGKARTLAHQPAGRLPRPRIGPGTAGLPPPGRIRRRLPGSRRHRSTRTRRYP